MDSAKIENLGLKPIEKQLKSISSIKSKNDLIKSIAWGHKLNGSPIFNIYAAVDAKKQ